MLTKKIWRCIKFSCQRFLYVNECDFFLYRFIPWAVDSPRCDAKKIAVLGLKLLGRKKKRSTIGCLLEDQGLIVSNPFIRLFSAFEDYKLGGILFVCQNHVSFRDKLNCLFVHGWPIWKVYIKVWSLFLVIFQYTERKKRGCRIKVPVFSRFRSFVIWRGHLDCFSFERSYLRLQFPSVLCARQ